MTLHQDQLLRAYPQTPVQVHQRIDETLLTIHRQAVQEPPKRYAVRLRFGVVLVAALLMLTAIGVAAGLHFGVFDFMEQIFGQEERLPEADSLVQNQLAVKGTAHTSIALSQAVYDGGHLRLVYSVRVKGAAVPVTAEEIDQPDSEFRQALAMDGVSIWGSDWFYLDGVEYIMPAGSINAVIPGGENGEALCYMDISLASAGIVPTDAFTVSLPILRKENGDRETLDFTVQATAEPFMPLVRQVKGAAITVQGVFLSPVRAYVNLHIQVEDGISSAESARLLADWRDAVLVDAHGNELAKCIEIETLAETDGVSADYSYTFFPTDATEVYMAPTIIDEDNRWLIDMSQAIELCPTSEK